VPILNKTKTAVHQFINIQQNKPKTRFPRLFSL